MESPCYNVEKKIDCPRRSAGCAVDCPDWAEYVKARDAGYLERRHEYDVVQVLADGKLKRDSYYAKSKIHSRTGRRG